MVLQFYIVISLYHFSLYNGIKLNQLTIMHTYRHFVNHANNHT